MPDSFKKLEIFVLCLENFGGSDWKRTKEKFSPSLFLFRKKLEHLRAFQIVYGLKRKKSKDGVRMLSAHEFLRDFQFFEYVLERLQ